MLDQILVLTPKFNVTTSRSQNNAEKAVKVKDTHNIFIVVRLNPSLRPLYSFLNPKKLLQCCLLAVYTRNPRVYSEEEEIKGKILHEILVF